MYKTYHIDGMMYSYKEPNSYIVKNLADFMNMSIANFLQYIINEGVEIDYDKLSEKSMQYIHNSECVAVTLATVNDTEIYILSDTGRFTYCFSLKEVEDVISEYIGETYNRVRELRKAAKMSQSKFSEYFHIPKRTICNWEVGIRKAPEYVVELIEYKLRNENLVSELPEDIVEYNFSYDFDTIDE